MTKHSAATHAKTPAAHTPAKTVRVTHRAAASTPEIKGGILVPQVTPGEQAIEDAKQTIKDERAKIAEVTPTATTIVPPVYRRLPRTPRDLAIQTVGVKTDQSVPIRTAELNVPDEFVLAGEFKDRRGNTWQLAVDEQPQAVLSPNELLTGGSDPGLFGLEAPGEAPEPVEGVVERSRTPSE